MALTLAVALSALLADTRGSAAEAPAAGVRLTAISSRASANGASLVIEASEPVSYVATRPDPLTLILDFRNADAAGLSESLPGKTPSPIATVAVDTVRDDAVTSRVRIALLQPASHRIRSNRNVVVVDFERSASGAASYVLPPASRASAPDAMLALAAAQATPAPQAVSVAQATPSPQAAATPQATALQAPAPQQAQAQAAAQGASAAQAPGARTYTGHPISFMFEGADLRAVLRQFSEISGLNIVIDPTVEGSVDVVLRDVPWDQALDQILRANKLGYVVDGTIVRIAPLAVLEAEAKAQTALVVAQAEAQPVTVWTHQLSYARGEDIRNMLRDARILSERGEAFVDPRTNMIIISDLQERIASAAQLIETLDRAQPQVEIEARIVQTNSDYARNLGIAWGFSGRVDPALGNTTNLAFPNSGTLTTATNLPINAQPASTAALTLGSVNGSFNLDVALSALESSGNGRLLSTPRVSTQNNVTAEITQGTQIPIQTVSNNTVTVQFQDAALKLRVTPQITAAGTVIMRIELENAEPDFARSVNGIPPIDTQRANTTVLVQDGETTVIGGIYLSREATVTDKTPGLSSIPFLGWFFKRDNVSERSTELLIFITPRILRG
jgi:type IV pilus assembly protein PilQ